MRSENLIIINRKWNVDSSSVNSEWTKKEIESYQKYRCRSRSNKHYAFSHEQVTNMHRTHKLSNSVNCAIGRSIKIQLAKQSEILFRSKIKIPIIYKTRKHIRVCSALIQFVLCPNVQRTWPLASVSEKKTVPLLYMVNNGHSDCKNW